MRVTQATTLTRNSTPPTLSLLSLTRLSLSRRKEAGRGCRDRSAARKAYVVKQADLWIRQLERNGEIDMMRSWDPRWKLSKRAVLLKVCGCVGCCCLNFSSLGAVSSARATYDGGSLSSFISTNCPNCRSIFYILKCPNCPLLVVSRSSKRATALRSRSSGSTSRTTCRASERRTRRQRASSTTTRTTWRSCAARRLSCARSGVCFVRAYVTRARVVARRSRWLPFSPPFPHPTPLRARRDRPRERERPRPLGRVGRRSVPITKFTYKT